MALTDILTECVCNTSLHDRRPELVPARFDIDLGTPWWITSNTGGVTKVVGPDGSNNAFYFTGDSEASWKDVIIGHDFVGSLYTPYSANDIILLSAYIKLGTTSNNSNISYCQIATYLDDNVSSKSAYASANFTTNTNGVISLTTATYAGTLAGSLIGASITSLGNNWANANGEILSAGWYRTDVFCKVTETPSGNIGAAMYWYVETNNDQQNVDFTVYKPSVTKWDGTVPLKDILAKDQNHTKLYLTVPEVANVKSGIQYGYQGISLTGTLVSSGNGSSNVYYAYGG